MLAVLELSFTPITDVFCEIWKFKGFISSTHKSEITLKKVLYSKLW